jgi:hypothetical protein
MLSNPLRAHILPDLCLGVMLSLLARSGLAQSQSFSMEDYYRIEKTDVHAHIYSDELDFVSLAKRDRFRFVNMAVWSDPTPQENLEKHRTVFLQFNADRDRTAPVVAFSLENWDQPDWSEQTIQYLDKAFKQGAVGVKVWKNIGMEFRDKDGKLITIDNPKFDSVFAFMKAQHKVLLGHLGEPKNCWLPLNEMTTTNDRSYFQENPQYHMALHPEMPSYEQQIAVRDRMLAKNPDLVFVACHLASLEWNVDEVASFLDRFPQAMVEVAARTGQLQLQSHQNRRKVVDFFVKYQDRILYGTDTGVDRNSNSVLVYQKAHEKWLQDWKYFNTDQVLSVPELDYAIQGLALPKEVVEKIYRINALRTFPSSWGQG